MVCNPRLMFILIYIKNLEGWIPQFNCLQFGVVEDVIMSKWKYIYASEIFTRNLVNYNNSTISGS